MDHGENTGSDENTPGPALSLDRLLRFDAWVSERYERERGAERVRMLRHQTYVGLILYNVYNFTDMLLMPDIHGLSLSLRLLVVTPGSLFLAWLVGQVGPKVREALVAYGISSSFAILSFMFWSTAAPLGSYVFAELALILVYGNMLLLRFPQAIVFTTCALAVATAVTLTKPGIPNGLQVAFMVQIVTACSFTLYANYGSEFVRCHSYIEELRAILKSEASDVTSHHLLDLSLTDALTTLPNRRSLDQTVESWSHEERALAIMMIDVDHFKLFNDALGHPAGDECLRAIAVALSSVTTGTDHFVGRFGGEEFTVVARDLNAFQAARLAKTFVDAVKALGITHPGRADGHGVVTISVGVVVKTIDMDLQTTFKLADEALYDAKHRGRNRFVLSDPNVDLSAQLSFASTA